MTPDSNSWKAAAVESLKRRLGQGWRQYLQAQRRPCVVRLDRLAIRTSEFPKKALCEVPGLRVTRDHRLAVKDARNLVPYERVCVFSHSDSDLQISIEYKKRVPWVAPCRIVFRGDDQTGLRPVDVGS